MIVYLSADQILEIHRLQIDEFAGSHGVRDIGGVESAAARPAMTFGGEDLHADLASKAAALMESLVKNHPFLDGNKRTGAAAAEFFLILNRRRVAATDAEFEDACVSLARGDLRAEELAIWFRQRLIAAE